MASTLRDMDDSARALARDLLASARHAALAVSDPADGQPMVSRIAMARAPNGAPLSLISDLSAHADALKANAHCAILVGEPGEKGDPLTHPRLSLKAVAGFVRHGDDGYDALARHYLDQVPKAKLYIGFADFSLVIFEMRGGLLNGGFGKAYPVQASEMLIR